MREITEVCVTDAFLAGLEQDPAERILILKFRSSKGEFEIRAEGVERVLMDEFLEQNIADQAFVYAQDSTPDQTQDLLASVMFHRDSANDISDQTQKAILHDTVDAIANGESVLLQIVPIYGARLLALASSIVVK